MPFVELSAELLTVSRALAGYAECSVLDAAVGEQAPRLLREATDRVRVLDAALRSRGLSLVYPDPLAGYGIGTGQGLIYQNDPPQADIWSTLAVQIARANGEEIPAPPIVTSTGFLRIPASNNAIASLVAKPVIDDCEGLSSLLAVVLLSVGYKRVWSVLGQPEPGGMGHNWITVEGSGPFGDAPAPTVIDASALCGMRRPPLWLYDHPRQARTRVRTAKELIAEGGMGPLARPLPVQASSALVPDWMMKP